MFFLFNNGSEANHWFLKKKVNAFLQPKSVNEIDVAIWCNMMQYDETMRWLHFQTIVSCRNVEAWGGREGKDDEDDDDDGDGDDDDGDE